MGTDWPALNYIQGKETYATLHLFTQIVGKIKLATLPWINHSWHVTLMVTPNGLTTMNLPAKDKSFQIDFDFLEHKLKIICSDGETRKINLSGTSVAGFYEKVFEVLDGMGIKIRINKTPNEMVNAISFDQDNLHANYIPEQAAALHRALLKMQDVFLRFRARFSGKCSPVHFFWGSFDLAVTRFSGRKGPKHPGGIPNLPDWVVQEAYSHELSSAGFWPGDNNVQFAAFYSYGYPEPEFFKDYPVRPREAYYDNNMREFLLPYEVVRQSDDPENVLMEFLQSSYEAAAVTGNWDRNNLERM
jgi:hypothetical protein